MRIAILITGFPPRWVGGTETQTMQMAKHLAKKHTVTIITRREKGDKQSEKRDGYTIRRFRYVNFPVLRFVSHIISSLCTIRKIRKDTDVLQCMMITPNGFSGLLAKKLFGLKVSAWTRSDYKKSIKRNWISGIIARYVVRNLDLIITQTESIRKEVLADKPKKCVAIPNGVEESKRKAKGNKIVFVGNLTERKGIIYLIQAIRMMKEKAGFIIVGDGPERKKLQKMSKGLDIRFVGKVTPEKVREHLLKGMIFVFPSISGKGEGMPNVILEAMSVGLPIVATKVAGIPEMVKDDKNGLVVPEKDPGQLALALDKLVTNNSLRKSMSERNVKVSNSFNFQSLVNNLEKAYSSI